MRKNRGSSNPPAIFVEDEHATAVDRPGDMVADMDIVAHRLNRTQQRPAGKVNVIEVFAALCLGEGDLAGDGGITRRCEMLRSDAKHQLAALGGADGSWQRHADLAFGDYEGTFVHDAAQESDRRIAEEAGDEGGLRIIVHFGRRGDLDNLAFLHDGDAVAHAHRFHLVMGDEDGGDAGLALQAANFRAHFEAQLGVEIGERFIEQQHVGLADQGARQRHALLLAAGKLGRPPAHQIADLDEGGDLVDLLADLGGRHTLYLQRKADVFGDRHVRVERIGLEDNADIAGLARQVGDIAVAEEDASAGRPVNAADRKKRRRFAAAGRTEQRQHLAVADFELHILDDLGGAEALREIVEEDAHQPLLPPP
ncbi:hypothetical protein RHECNPAF_930033 [Rhizobium etli CNPAF512]|nr:hypothetical protein RHECNPAF_930033 [Rhizobium etli CNPAF512]